MLMAYGAENRVKDSNNTTIHLTFKFKFSGNQKIQCSTTCTCLPSVTVKNLLFSIIDLLCKAKAISPHANIQ